MVVTEEEANYLNELEAEMEELNKKNRQLASAQLQMYNQNSDENLIKYQLNIEEEIERIYHLLKGERLRENEKGEQFWEPPKDNSYCVLTDYGIDYVMNVMTAFLNRNIILSDFDPDRINAICLEIGMQIADDLYNDQHRMFKMETPENEEESIKRYPIIVHQIVINIEAALRRATFARERESLRKVMNVSQNSTYGMGMNQQPNYPVIQPQNKKQFKLYNPTTWI